MTVGMAAALGAERLDTTTAIRTDAATYDMRASSETAPCQQQGFGRAL